jgi:hypothetical protein
MHGIALIVPVAFYLTAIAPIVNFAELRRIRIIALAVYATG